MTPHLCSLRRAEQLPRVKSGSIAVLSGVMACEVQLGFLLVLVFLCERLVLESSSSSSMNSAAKMALRAPSAVCVSYEAHGAQIILLAAFAISRSQFGLCRRLEDAAGVAQSSAAGRSARAEERLARQRDLAGRRAAPHSWAAGGWSRRRPAHVRCLRLRRGCRGDAAVEALSRCGWRSFPAEDCWPRERVPHVGAILKTSLRLAEPATFTDSSSVVSASPISTTKARTSCSASQASRARVSWARS